jgi:hypothetical protein
MALVAGATRGLILRSVKGILSAGLTKVEYRTVWRVAVTGTNLTTMGMEDENNLSLDYY